MCIYMRRQNGAPGVKLSFDKDQHLVYGVAKHNLL